MCQWVPYLWAQGQHIKLNSVTELPNRDMPLSFHFLHNCANYVWDFFSERVIFQINFNDTLWRAVTFTLALAESQLFRGFIEDLCTFIVIFLRLMLLPHLSAVALVLCSCDRWIMQAVLWFVFILIDSGAHRTLFLCGAEQRTQSDL